MVYGHGVYCKRVCATICTVLPARLAPLRLAGTTSRGAEFPGITVCAREGLPARWEELEVCHAIMTTHIAESPFKVEALNKATVRRPKRRLPSWRPGIEIVETVWLSSPSGRLEGGRLLVCGMSDMDWCNKQIYGLLADGIRAGLASGRRSHRHPAQASSSEGHECTYRRRDACRSAPDTKTSVVRPG